jgi:hypothetical protein
MEWEKLKKSVWVEILFIGVISAIVYLPNAHNLSYYKDDWYYMFDGLVNGPNAFIEMFRHLRPARGPLYAMLFSLFGLNPLPYHLLLYGWRLLGGLGALWIFKILWPKQRHAAFFMALFFLIYPGFLWWVAGFEYQPMVMSVTLQVFSIALTLKFVEQAGSSRRWAWLAASILAGWAYLAFVEYAIGMEVFRWLAVYLMISQRNPKLGFIEKARRTLGEAAVTLIIPLGFLLWHQLIFQNQRKAADISLQAGHLFNSPLTTMWWLVRTFQSVLNVLILAWGVPFSNLFYSERLREILASCIGAGGVVGLVFFINRIFISENDKQDDMQEDWPWAAISIGFWGTVAGVLPIIVVNRYVEFERFSHYALPSSLAGVVFVGGIVYAMKSRAARLTALSLLVGLATLTHAANANVAVAQERTISAFWWQVAWRAPQIMSGSTLVVRYPDIDYGEGSDVVWGPANFIYYPEKQPSLPVQVSLPGARMEGITIKQMLSGVRLEQNYIVINAITLDFAKMLILTQPSEGSCVHAVDARWPGLSMDEDATVIASATHSHIERIVTQGVSPDLLDYLFGGEPAHGWCYYYQKADLARQQGDWKAIARIGSIIEGQGLHPNDQIEWMPFLQAYAYLDDLKQVKLLSTRINTEVFYKQQACETMAAMGSFGYPLTNEMSQLIQESFCAKH